MIFFPVQSTQRHYLVQRRRQEGEPAPPAGPLTRDGEAREAHGQSERSDGDGRVPREGDDEEEHGLHAEAAAVEDLPHVGRRQDVVLPEVVGQLPPERHDDRHHQVGQGGHGAALGETPTGQKAEGHRG